MSDTHKILIMTYLVFVALDIITGLLKSFKMKKFKSSQMRDGGFKKGAVILFLSLIFFVDFVQCRIDLGFKVPLFTGVSTYFALMEFGSIIENLCKIEPKISKVVKDFLGGVIDESNWNM